MPSLHGSGFSSGFDEGFGPELPFQIKDVLVNLKSKLGASGFIRYTQIGEPKGAIASASRVGAAIYLVNARVVGVPLGGSPGTTEAHSITIRFYMNMLDEPQDQIEFLLMSSVSKIAEDIEEDFTLDGLIRNVDIGGEYGEALNVTYGFIELSGVVYRIAELNVTLTVDNAVLLAP